MKTLSLAQVLSLFLALCLCGCTSTPTHAGGTPCKPPFGGTIFIDPDIVTPADPSTFVGATYTGQGMRHVYDRRIGWTWINAYLFDATFTDGLTSEIQVNPEFGSVAAATTEALFYGEAVGQLPTALRVDVAALWIHAGVEPFGGGNNSILIHTGQGANYVASGILEETLIHEACHTSLDVNHAAAPGWLAAQAGDNCFISDYAENNPTTEDVAESFVPYFAIRYRSDRISNALENTILQSIPNRIAYFDSIGLNLYPVNPVPFRRGDCNNDGVINIADAVRILTLLFPVAGPPPTAPCYDACDCNDDETQTIADGVCLLTRLFSQQGPPTPPPVTCGPDPSGAGLGCLASICAP